MSRGGAGGGNFQGNFPDWQNLHVSQNGNNSFRSVASKGAGEDGNGNGGNGGNGGRHSPEGGRRQFSEVGSEMGEGNRKMEAATSFFKTVGEYVSVWDNKALKREALRQLEIVKGVNLNNCQSCEEVAQYLEEVNKNTEIGGGALERILGAKTGGEIVLDLVKEILGDSMAIGQQDIDTARNAGQVFLIEPNRSFILYEDSQYRRMSERTGCDEEGKVVEGGKFDSKGVACREEMIERGELGAEATLKEYVDARGEHVYGKSMAEYFKGKSQMGEGDNAIKNGEKEMEGIKNIGLITTFVEDVVTVLYKRLTEWVELKGGNSDLVGERKRMFFFMERNIKGKMTRSSSEASVLCSVIQEFGVANLMNISLSLVRSFSIVSNETDAEVEAKILKTLRNNETANLYERLTRESLDVAIVKAAYRNKPEMLELILTLERKYTKRKAERERKREAGEEGGGDGQSGESLTGEILYGIRLRVQSNASIAGKAKGNGGGNNTSNSNGKSVSFNTWKLQVKQIIIYFIQYFIYITLTQ